MTGPPILWILCCSTAPFLTQDVLRIILSKVARWANTGTEDVANGKNTARNRKTLPSSLWRIAQRKIALILAATTIESLRVPPSNHLEKLAGERKGQHSVRINDQYRVCFRWDSRNAEATQIEIVDYH